MRPHTFHTHLQPDLKYHHDQHDKHLTFIIIIIIIMMSTWRPTVLVMTECLGVRESEGPGKPVSSTSSI